MTLNITEKEAISTHLSQIKETEHYTIFSGLMAALRDARKVTGRNQDSGEKIEKDNCGYVGSWLGNIGYLVLLDQIGRCFKPKSVATILDRPLIVALLYFGGVSLTQAEAIYALRCSLAHDFGTFNTNNKRPSLTHFFTLHIGASPAVVTLPRKPWDGDILNLNSDNVTYVSLEALGDLVERLYHTLLELSTTDDLEIVLNGGAQELAVRYSFYSPKYPPL